MSLILNIDTALDSASVCLAEDERILQSAVNDNRNDHATWLHTAIINLLNKNNYTISQLNAVAVSIGPGSYTGLRIGLSAAKGFCYALHIPLITVNTLEMLAWAVKDEAANMDFICPMIDARRMEVFTAVYDKMLTEIQLPYSLIIEETSFASLLSSSKILFCGNGSNKAQSIIHSKNAFYSKSGSNATHLANFSHKRFQKNQFADVAYTEPFYLKEFYSADSRLKGLS